MKFYHFLYLALFFFISCTGPIQEKVSDADDSEEGNKKTEFQGVWINEKYVKDILKKKSPRRSQDVAEISFLKFDQKNQVLIILNFHEGDGGTLVKKESGYFLKRETGSIQKIKKNTDGEIEFSENKFIKCKTCKEGKILEALLFAGTYELDGEKVTFHEDGRVEGLEDFKYYIGVDDYNDQGLDVDQIQLKKGKDDRKYYGFKFKRDNLYIYDLECKEFDKESNTCAFVKNGKVKYQLKKLSSKNPL